MEITQLYAACFSPTGTSRQAARKICGGIKGYHPILIDFTLPQNRQASHTFSGSDLLLLALPVYGGRIPLPAADMLEKLHGKNTPVILAAVYGNRAYEDALLEMADIMTAQGFRPIAAGAFSVEHCMSKLVGEGRPNAEDCEMMEQLGRQAMELLAEGLPANALEVLGSRPYKERKPKAPVAPVTGEVCTECGLCVQACPVGAISEQNPRVTDAEKCILCQACEKICPMQARRVTDPQVLKMVRFLEENCRENRPNELFFCKQ